MMRANSVDEFKIGIIDRGVQRNHPRLQRCRLTGISICQKKHKISFKKSFVDNNGHGTAIAGIIHQMVPEAQILAVKLEGEHDIINETLLYEGIKWCLSDPAVKVINISLGVLTNAPLQALHEICLKAHSQNVTIVAATHNMPGAECYPAYFPTVFGVTSGAMRNKFEYGFIEQAAVNIISKGTTKRVAWKNSGYKITSGNSYAAAHFTGIVAKSKIKTPEISGEELFSLVRENASKEVRQLQYVDRSIASFQYLITQGDATADPSLMFDSNTKISFAKKVALFPASEKEIKTIREFESLCNVRINALIDFPNIFTGNDSQKVLRRLPTDSEFKKFDTIVLGYFLDQQFDANILFAHALIERAIDLNKNFIVWDEHVSDLVAHKIKKVGNDYKGKIVFNKIDQSLIPSVMNFRHLSDDCPTLCVIGTSNKQGKITTQLRIKNILAKSGYKVSHISSEPQCILLGADFVFPYGHNSAVKLPEESWGVFLNAAKKGVQEVRTPDIIISGTQGGVIPRAFAILPEFASMYFLSGVQPDAVVCSINPQDDIELIVNTLNIVKLYTRATPLFLVMVPWMREYISVRDSTTVTNLKPLSKIEYKTRAKEIEEKVKLRVIDIMDSNNDKFILKSIQKVFART